MDQLVNLLVFLAIGALAGWGASRVMGGKGQSIIIYIILGLIGAVIGGYLFGLLGINLGGLIGLAIAAFVGAIILIAIVRALRKI